MKITYKIKFVPENTFFPCKINYQKNNKIQFYSVKIVFYYDTEPFLD